MLNTAQFYVQQREWAEDISQDVFIEIFRSISSFNERATLKTWIYRITVNKCLDALRAKKRQKRYGFILSIFNQNEATPFPDAVHFEHPGIIAEKREFSVYLFKALEKLADAQKSAFILTQMEGLSQKETAGIMLISEKAVESLTQRAKMNLRKRLEKIYPERRKNN